MDRNRTVNNAKIDELNVALRKESVDRNDFPVVPAELTTVALRKESVDRNFNVRYTTSPRPRSLSARRAWIEITPPKEWATLGGSRSPQGERG